MKILYIHHCGVFGGASKSLFENIKILHSSCNIDPVIVTPYGSTADIFSETIKKTYKVSGICKFDHTIVGYYQKFRWLVLFREFAYILPTIIVLLKIRKREKGIDLIHVNDICSIFPALLAKIIFKIPCIIHARTVLSDDGSWRRYFIAKLLSSYMDKVIAIDENVRDSLPHKENCIIVHNGLCMDGIDIDSISCKNRNEKLVVGFLGNYLKQKGIYEFVQSAYECKKQNLPIDFCIVGPKNINKSILSRILSFFKIKEEMVGLIDAYVERNKLDNIKFIPFQKDIRTIMPMIDLLCFPSKMEGIGRPVFEAAFFKKPSIVALSNPKNDTFINYKTGIVIPAGTVLNLVSAYRFFLNHPNEIGTMGNFAHSFACQKFDIQANTLNIFEAYNNVANKKNIKE